MERKNITMGGLIGYVAGILNERELLINIGENAGVRMGMKFKILGDPPIEVKDPISHEILTTFNWEKVRVEAVEVQERFSVCKTYRKYKIGTIPTLTNMVDLLSIYEGDVYETMKIDSASQVPSISAEERVVKNGDKVVQIIEEEK